TPPKVPGKSTQYVPNNPAQHKGHEEQPDRPG
ncbi:unnamed protein product, partial [marine sediment metagenome]